MAVNVTFGGNGIAGSGADFSLTSCARDLASGVSPTLGGWVVVKQPNGHLLHFNWLGWIAVAAGLLSIAVARIVRVNDTGAPSPLANLEGEAQPAS